MNILTIDAQNTDGEDLIKSMRETGFAVINNYSLNQDTLNLMYREWENFFNLPTEEKMRHVQGKSGGGYFPFKSENAKDSDIKDLKEFYHLYPDLQLPDGMSLATEYVCGELSSLAHMLLVVLYGKSPENMRPEVPYYTMVDGSPKSLFRILHYPPLSPDDDPRAVRAAPHEDINLITLLPAATQPGLEVKDLSGKWHQIEADPCTVIVNVGDMLQEASSGFYKSTTHRVVNPEENVSRYSAPLFIHPHPSTVLSERYTAGQYLEERLKEILK